MLHAGLTGSANKLGRAAAALHPPEVDMRVKKHAFSVSAHVTLGESAIESDFGCDSPAFPEYLRPMHMVTQFIEQGPALIAWVVLGVAFAVLSKGADVFVESSVAIAERLKIPKLVIGIVLVSLATTSPELSVSLFSALQGKPEMALGNAVGSIICNSGLALALCAVLSSKPIPVIPRVLTVTGGFLLGVSLLTFLFVMPDHTLERWEGGVLLLLFAGYMVLSYRDHKRGRHHEHIDLETLEEDVNLPTYKLILLFLGGLAMVIIASRFVIVSAITIARSLNIPEAVIALTLVALGTSIPEVATSITAARKGQGELSAGNILGANIMNICWVAGASAVANNLTLQARELYFMFPAMFILLIAALLVMRTHHRLSRPEGAILAGLYVLYLASFLLVFRSAGG
jgi:cation:H+ antiporter